MQRRADGETFSASLTVAPVGNGTEEVTGAIAIAVDVSARVQAQSKAKEASSRYETLVDATAARDVPLRRG